MLWAFNTNVSLSSFYEMVTHSCAGKDCGWVEEETAPLEAKLSPCIYYLKVSDPPLD